MRRREREKEISKIEGAFDLFHVFTKDEKETSREMGPKEREEGEEKQKKRLQKWIFFAFSL